MVRVREVRDVAYVAPGGRATAGSDQPDGSKSSSSQSSSSHSDLPQSSSSESSSSQSSPSQSSSSHSKSSQTLDLYLPEVEGRPPLIAYFHGGAFKFGDKTSALLPKWLTQEGFAVAGINYRLSGEATFPAAAIDAKAAIRFLRAKADEYGYDPNRIAAWGESAGGWIAAFVATTGDDPAYEEGDHREQSSRVQAAVVYYAPIDFLQMDQHLPGEWANHEEPGSPESLFLGAPVKTVPDLVRQANPAEHLKPGTPPLFVASGNKDVVVPVQQSQILVTAAGEARVEAAFMILAGADHVFEGAMPADIDRLDAAVLKFLRRHLA